MLNRLKRVVSKILCSARTGKMLKALGTKSVTYYGGVRIPVGPLLPDHAIAAAFFGLYEKAEALMIQKHLKSTLPVIELGTSLGIISSLTGIKSGTSHLICVEPNPALRKHISYVLEANNIYSYEIVSAAYSSHQLDVLFHPGKTNLTGSITGNAQENAITVPGISLARLRTNYDITKSFNLICDIEGAEIDLILNEPGQLNDCNMMIIELHEATDNQRKYSVEEIKELIESIGFQRVDNRGRVFVFRNINK